MKLKIRKGATVEVITGSDKGKRGAVLDIDKAALRIRVQGVKIVTRHSKKDGLVKSEAFIDYSNVKLIEAAKPAAKKAKAKKEKSA
jgi:large subunit ribosomal protein L24